MNTHARAMDAAPPPLPLREGPLREGPHPDLGPLMVGPLMIGPLSVLRMWAEMSRTASNALPASLLLAAAPFFWAPPLWVGALMAASRPPSAPSRGFTAIDVSR